MTTNGNYSAFPIFDSDGEHFMKHGGLTKSQKWKWKVCFKPSITSKPILRTPKEGYWINILEDISQKIFVCEGAKKAGALLSNDFAGVSIPGNNSRHFN